MKFTFLPINKVSLYFYFVGLSLLLFSWFDQWQQLYLVSDKLRIQLFISAIIIIAIAAIINLTLYVFNLYSGSADQHNKNNSADDH